MTDLRCEIALCPNERDQLTPEALASSAGLHPALVERFVEFGLLDRVRVLQCENEWMRGQS